MLWVGLPIADLLPTLEQNRSQDEQHGNALLACCPLSEFGRLAPCVSDTLKRRTSGVCHGTLDSLITCSPLPFELHANDQTNRTQIPCERPPSYEQDTPGAQPALPLVVCASAPPGGPPAVDARSKVAQAGVAHAFRGM